MNEDELRRFLKDEACKLDIDEDLFASGVLDSLMAIELLEIISTSQQISISDLSENLEKVSSIRRILKLTN